MDSNIFVKLSDDDFRLEAFAEYCARAQERYSNLIAAFQSIPEKIPDDTDEPLTQQEVDAIVSDIKNEFGLVNSAIALQSGYTTVDDALSTMVQSVDKACLQYSETPDSDAETLYTSKEIPARDILGNATEPLNLSYAELADELKANYHSLVCLSAAATSYNEIKTGIADMLSVFNDRLADVFDNVHNDISSSAEYYKGVIRSSVDSNDFLSKVMDLSGVSSEAEATSETADYKPEQADISQYTGASPSCALDFSTAQKALTTVGKIAATAVAGIGKAVAFIGKKIFKAGKKYLKETLVDPMDLDIVDKDGFGTVDGFQYQSITPSTNIILDLPDSDLPNTATNVALLNEYFSGKVGTWLTFKTRFHEIFIELGSLQFTRGATKIHVQGSLSKYVIKPRVVNIKAIENAFNTINATYLYSYAEVESFLDALNALGSEVYDVSQLSEKDRFKGLVWAHTFGAFLITYGYAQMYQDTTYIERIYSPSNCDWPSLPGTVTNLDFVKMFCGHDGTASGSFELTAKYAPNTGYTWFSEYTDTFFDSLIGAFVAAIGYEQVHPNLSAPFVPFSTNHSSYAKPSFAIHTDDTNKNAFSKLLTTAVIVAIVAIVAITATVLVKKISRKMYFKRAQKVGVLDAKMWNGEKLTNREQRQYVRATKKMEASNIFAKGLAASDGNSIFQNIDIGASSSAVSDQILKYII